MNSMFFNASVFNQNISNWNLHPNVTFSDFKFGSPLSNDNTPLRFR